MGLVDVLREGEVVPDVIDQVADETHQVRDIRISWVSGGDVIATLDKPGKVLTPRQTHDTPRMELRLQQGTDEKGQQMHHGKFYTVVKTDPDAPSRAAPKWREILHWVRGNCPVQRQDRDDDGKSAPYVDVTNGGEEVAPYIGAGAPKDTSLHRYIFLVYEHDAPIKFSENWTRSADNRPQFKVRDFAKKYGLGDPVGVTYYQAEYDEWSDKLFD